MVVALTIQRFCQTPAESLAFEWKEDFLYRNPWASASSYSCPNAEPGTWHDKDESQSMDGSE